jgi:hypothetical protein
MITDINSGIEIHRTLFKNDCKDIVLCKHNDININHHDLKISNIFKTKNLNEIGEDEKYIYYINLLLVNDYFKNSFGFINLDKKVLTDINTGKAILVIIDIYEAYSGKSFGLGSEDFDILNKWIIEANLNFKNIFFITGNLFAYDRLKNNYKFNIVSLTMQEMWNDVYGSVIKPLSFLPEEKKYLFLSFNRAPRLHRFRLILELMEKNLIDEGRVSYNFETPDFDSLTHQSPSKYIKQFEILKEKKTQFVDVDNSPSNLAINLNIDLMEKTFLTLVTETQCDSGTLQITEKIWKPIMCGHPFMVLSSNRCLEVLKNLGFKTYSNWFNESYDNANTLEEKLDIIVENLNKYKKYNISDLKKIRNEMNEISEYNQRNMFNHCVKKFNFLDKENNVNGYKPLLDVLYSLFTHSNKIT